jgi:hypothetical protein
MARVVIASSADADYGEATAFCSSRIVNGGWLVTTTR